MYKVTECADKAIHAFRKALEKKPDNAWLNRVLGESEIARLGVSKSVQNVSGVEEPAKVAGWVNE